MSIKILLFIVFNLILGLAIFVVSSNFVDENKGVVIAHIDKIPVFSGDISYYKKHSNLEKEDILQEKVLLKIAKNQSFLATNKITDNNNKTLSYIKKEDLSFFKKLLFLKKDYILLSEKNAQYEYFAVQQYKKHLQQKYTSEILEKIKTNDENFNLNKKTIKIEIHLYEDLINIIKEKKFKLSYIFSEDIVSITIENSEVIIAENFSIDGFDKEKQKVNILIPFYHLDLLRENLHKLIIARAVTNIIAEREIENNMRIKYEKTQNNDTSN